MTNEIYDALGQFGTTITTAINPVDILKVMGTAVGGGVVIFLTVWGAKKVFTMVKNALRGRLSIGK